MKHTFICAAALLLIVLNTVAQETQKKNLYAKQNLIAWCIVPFDNKNRTPEERAQMLNKLGINKLAYDWREKHVSINR